MEAMSLYPYSSMKPDRPALILWKTSMPTVPMALPTWNADAPAMMYSAASLQDAMPPTPMIGMSRTVLRSYTALTPTGLTQGPESPPNLLLSSGLANSGSMTMAFSVLIATTASPPASWTALPMSGRMCVLGVSLAQTGTLTTDLTAETMSLTIFGSVPTSMPYPFACGQDRFSSTALAP
jgi:hypothetical protein